MVTAPTCLLLLNYFGESKKIKEKAKLKIKEKGKCIPKIEEGEEEECSRVTGM
jgi:hypothetical protein